MRVKINAKSDGHRVRMSFWVPTGAAALPGVSKLLANKTENVISPNQLRALIRAVKKTRRKFGPMTIVDVETADGDIVKISI
ncbi:MAG TPA: hypothetical protein PK629_11265 [Oscillospiraceae bacterium]|nr:hypothetical protein [Oscillospiraceae bacterium]HPF55563.1 hypothetical protein [Clostridiales bacterium]HPK34650.1 hypothetical protein [Oscillospiraceae bacterium]HPR74585.1 hypothetical protein [Oscillospiraceae bacterium]